MSKTICLSKNSKSHCKPLEHASGSTKLRQTTEAGPGTETTPSVAYVAQELEIEAEFRVEGRGGGWKLVCPSRDSLNHRRRSHPSLRPMERDELIRVPHCDSRPCASVIAVIPEFNFFR